MKKKLKKFIHKYISIPKYEKELREKDNEIAELKGAYNFVYAQMHKYKNKVIEMKMKEED